MFGAILGCILGATLLVLVVNLGLRQLGARPVLEVRRVPLVLHGGAPLAGVAGPQAAALRWRQAVDPLVAEVDTVSVQAADLGHLVPFSVEGAVGADAAVLRARHGLPHDQADATVSWSPWQAAVDVRFEVRAGVEGALRGRLPMPLPARVPLEFELVAARGAPGAQGSLSPFLRYRGPLRSLGEPPNRVWTGRTFERRCAAEANGLAPLAGVAVAIDEVDLRGGPLRVTLRRADDGARLAAGTCDTGGVLRGGHALVHFESPVTLPRALPLQFDFELPSDGSLLGDAAGPGITGLFGTPSTAGPLGPLSLVRPDGVATGLEFTDLALRLDGPTGAASDGRGMATLLRVGTPRGIVLTVVGASLWLLCAALAGVALVRASERPPSADRAWRP